MATYLQGVTPYIPQVQPFQEDLNFYSNVLQTKQQQYDSNYKKLNQVYGQYFYADLTREGNIEKKEQLLNNINFQLQRVAGMDLSLEQNVNQAVQVFKPFYEDKNLMKDMAWTKNYNREIGLAQGLRRSSDEERSKQYWDTGVQALNFKRAEFAEASDEEAMQFGNVRYTPFVNAMEKAKDLAKDAGLSIETINMSPDGKWIIKQKNGQALTEPLTKLFESVLGNDPRIQEVYKTQAYVDRKNYAYGNASMFDGDVKAAEMKYLEDNYNMFKQQTALQKKQMELTSQTYDNKIKDIEKQISEGKADPKAKMYLEQLKYNKQINDASLNRMSSLANSFEESSDTPSTSTGFQNPYGDIETLRNKIDAARASSLMQKDFGEAANIFAYRNSSTDMTANPYAVNQQKHNFQMAQIGARTRGMKEVAKLKARLDRKNIIDEANLKSGNYHAEAVPMLDANGNPYVDAEGNPVMEYVVVPNEGLEELFTEKSGETSTPEYNLKTGSRQISKNQVNAYAVPAFKQIDLALTALKSKGEIQDSEIKQLLDGRSLEQFRSMYQKYPEYFSREVLGSNGLQKIAGNVSAYLDEEGNGNLSAIEPYKQNLQKAMGQLNAYTSYLDADQDWRKKTSKVVESELYANGFKYAKYLYDNNGKLRTEEEFYAMIPEEAIEEGSVRPSSYDDMGNKRFYSGEAEFFKQKTVKKRNIDYNAMKKAAAVIYSDGKRISAPPGISSNGLGTGISTDVQSIEVTPGSPHLKGYNHWVSVTRNFRNLDFGDTDNIRASVSGFTTKGSMEKDAQRTLNLTAQDILNQLTLDSRNLKSGLGNFKMSYANVAEGRIDRNALVLNIDDEWLSKYFDKRMKGASDEKKEALYTIREGISQNGLAIVTDANSMNNSLKQAATMGPIEAAVRYNKSYEYKDPDSPSTFAIKLDESGVNEYLMDTKLYTYDPKTNNFVPGAINYSTPLVGQTPDGAYDNFMDIIAELHETNKILANQLEQ